MGRYLDSFSVFLREPVHGGYYRGFLLALMWFFLTTASSLATNPPAGPYQASCRDIVMAGTTLWATCQNYFGGMQKTALNDAASCTGIFKDVDGVDHTREIYDIDGSLRCVLARSWTHGKYLEEFDVISMPVHHALAKGVEETVWRIDRPTVWSSRLNGAVDYPMITFHPGDKILISARGCVQTGGSGNTWKSYSDPSGPNAEELYSGTIFIRSVTLGGFEKIGPFMRQGWRTIPPAPPLSNRTDILTLGYNDNQMDDNGYYSHDNGTGDQCKNVGPAWLEIHVISGLPLRPGPLLSPHSRPFDLVWDMAKDEDPNGLPMNPQWNYTLQNPVKPPNPPKQPHFIPLCGPAFPSKDLGQYEIDMGTLARICTSMSPDFDLRPSGGGLCGGDPFPGHLNFGIATYQGPITFETWSGTAPNDDDLSFALRPPNGAGLAGRDDTLAPGSDIHSEFDAGEVAALQVTPFWKDLFWPIYAMPGPKMFSTFDGPDGKGLQGVIIGEVGLDGVHGANTELHPVFAMAVRVSQMRNPNRPDEMEEKWAFFLRNYGDEGSCSESLWFWDGGPEFFIPLEWPAGVTGHVVASSIDVVRWQEAPTPIHLEADPQQHFTLIRVTAPEGDEGFGVGGTVTLVYNVAGAPKKKAAKAAPPPQRRKYTETEVEDFSARITDPAVKAKYEAEVKALPPMAKPRPVTALPVEVPTTVSAHKHVPGSAAHGVLVRSSAVPNTTKIEWDQQMYKILQTHQQDLKIELPVALPAKFAPKVIPAEPK